MSNTPIWFREFRYLIHDHSIEVYVRIEVGEDCPIGVAGWHYQHFVDGVDNVEDRLTERRWDGQWSVENIAMHNSMSWPQKAP